MRLQHLIQQLLDQHMKVDKHPSKEQETFTDHSASYGESGNALQLHRPSAGPSDTPRRYIALTALSPLAIPLFSAAYDQIEHDGKLYACQHRCSMTHLPGGQVHIRYTNGGWAALIVVNGGIIVDEEPKQP